MKFNDATNNKKIKKLTGKLVKEIESQGKTLHGLTLPYIQIWILEDNSLLINNATRNWEVYCGKYKVKRGN